MGMSDSPDSMYIVFQPTNEFFHCQNYILHNSQLQSFKVFNKSIIVPSIQNRNRPIILYYFVMINPYTVNLLKGKFCALESDWSHHYRTNKQAIKTKSFRRF